MSAAQALGSATAAMLQGRDVSDVIGHLVRDSAPALSADAIGVLLRTGSGSLELLSASSHAAAELEIYQIQQDDGPCVDAIRQAVGVTCIGEGAIVQRWPRVGPAVVAAGYRTVHAYPLRWRDITLGALNIFRTADHAPSDELDQLGQAFADLTTLIIVQSAEPTVEQITERVQSALRARTVIEQAKGVLAYTRGVDMASAYDLLVAESDSRGQGLTDVARDIVTTAYRGPEL